MPLWLIGLLSASVARLLTGTAMPSSSLGHKPGIALCAGQSINSTRLLGWVLLNAPWFRQVEPQTATPVLY